MKPENLFNKIIGKSLENHEELLNKQLLFAGLKYINSLNKGLVQSPEKEDIGNIKNLLLKHTIIESFLHDEFKNRDNDFYDKNKEFEISAKVDLLINNIVEKHKNNLNWSTDIIKYIDNYFTNIGPLVDRDHKNNENKAGLISYSVENGIDKLIPQLGFNELDEVIDIHFDDLYKQKQNQNAINLFSNNSFQNLAVRIVDEFPYVKAVTGSSWLLDTPIVKRIGFNVYDRDMCINNNFSFWGQFVDSNGQIKNEDLDQFLNTGKSKYSVVSGGILVEDFLKKYLPRERRGEIVLKNVNHENKKIIDDDKNKIRKIKDIWTNISDQELIDIIYNTQIISGYFKTQIGEEYLKKIIEFKNKGMGVNGIEEDKEFEKYKNPFLEYLDSFIYINKKINIE